MPLAGRADSGPALGRIGPLLLCVGAAVWLSAALTACIDADDPAVMFHHGRYDAAFKTFHELADKGDVNAQNYLGVHFYLGLGVTRDFAKAARWFEWAAVRGHAGAQRNLGVLYLRGLGVRQDNIRAYAWFYKAYVQGNQRARPYLRFTSDIVTPNQTMQARAWVENYIEQANKERN